MLAGLFVLLLALITLGVPILLVMGIVGLVGIVFGMYTAIRASSRNLRNPSSQSSHTCITCGKFNHSSCGGEAASACPRATRPRASAAGWRRSTRSSTWSRT